MEGWRNGGKDAGMDEGRGVGMGPSTHPCPQGAGACMPCSKASRSGREPVCTRGLGQKTQAARRPGRRSAVKCCISHKGGLQWALLREIRETGNAEPSFNTHLIFMERQQRQPLCGERSPSTEGEQRFPNKRLGAGKHLHLVHKTTQHRGDVEGAGTRCGGDDLGFHPGSLSSGMTLSKLHILAGPPGPPPCQWAGRKWDYEEEGGID